MSARRRLSRYFALLVTCARRVVNVVELVGQPASTYARHASAKVSAAAVLSCVQHCSKRAVASACPNKVPCLPGVLPVAEPPDSCVAGQEDTPATVLRL